MKNSKLVKVVMGAIISLIVVAMINNVWAADNNSKVNDITEMLKYNNTVNNTVTNSTSNNTTRNNTVNNTTNNSVLTTNNTSSYNNTSLPKTGIEDHIPATILLVVFGVSAVYAYKKIQDYRNI